MSKEQLRKATLIVGLFGLVVAGRTLPHLPNCTPAAAAALFAGFFFASRATGVGIVLAAMAVSDLIIGAHHPAVMFAVYAALACPVLLRGWLRPRLTALRVVLGATACSLVFFVVTNLAHWLFMGVYAFTVEGLVACYTAALPFFRYTLVGDLLWSGVLFGTYALLMQKRLDPIHVRSRLPAIVTR